MTAIVDMPDFGQYQLLAEIGYGVRGPAFVARARADGGELLYLIEASAFASGEDQLLRAFMRDVDSAARLRHRNVIAIFERGANTAGPYVVMEYLECASLSELEERHRAIRPPRLVAATVIDALHGLHAAHALPGDPLTHGCVSPDHLLVGLDGTCRISGFGYARPRVQTNPSHRSRSGTGYMAPEQLVGGDIDRRADVFSMGVVLWNALTGKKLFHDRRDHATMSNVLERKVPRPSAIGLSPPPAFDAVVLKSLERDPLRRFQDAAEMAEALREAARGAACLAGSTEVGEWITTTFGSELAARRRTIRDIATRVPLPLAAPDVPLLARLGASVSPEPGARDELSVDELARASEPPPRAPTLVPTLAPIVAPAGYTDPGASRHLALVALIAFSAVAGILGWRWWLASAPPDVAALEAAATASAASAPAPLPIELEVTVLEVRPVAAPPPEPVPEATPAAPTEAASAASSETAAAEPADTARPRPADAADTGRRRDSEPVAAPARSQNPPASASPARVAPPPARPMRKRAPVRAEPPEAKPEPPAAPPPPRPEAPPRPALEPNPYLQK